MLHIENDYRTPIDSNYYQNNANNFNLKKPNHNQITFSFTPHFFLRVVHTAAIYIKIPRICYLHPKKKLGNHTPMKGLESNSIKIPTMNEIQTLHQKLSPLKPQVN